MAEIVRAGILSVDEGQVDAAQALGMTVDVDDAPHRVAAGDPRDHPADGQRVHLDAQDDVARLGHHLRRAAPAHRRHLLGESQRHRAAHRREHLVPRGSPASRASGSTTSSAAFRAAGGATSSETPLQRLCAPSAGRRSHDGHGQGRSRPQAVRPARSAQGHRPRSGARRGHGDHRAVGSGKSTFLRCINHLEKINAGRLWVDGELVGYREAGDKITSCASTKSRASAPRSAWCSSTSTCSRT